jgi:hypothetical protein
MTPQGNLLAFVGQHLGQRRAPTAGADDANVSNHGRSTQENSF